MEDRSATRSRGKRKKKKGRGDEGTDQATGRGRKKADTRRENSLPGSKEEDEKHGGLPTKRENDIEGKKKREKPDPGITKSVSLGKMQIGSGKKTE